MFYFFRVLNKCVQGCLFQNLKYVKSFTIASTFDKYHKEKLRKGRQKKNTTIVTHFILKKIYNSFG